MGERTSTSQGRAVRAIGNALWLALCGFWVALGWLAMAAILSITIVGVPFARQCLQLAGFSLSPYGRKVVPDPTVPKPGRFGEVLWIIPGGLLALGYLIGGFLLSLTFIGLPFEVKATEMVGVALHPFGKAVVPTDGPDDFYPEATSDGVAGQR